MPDRDPILVAFGQSVAKHRRAEVRSQKGRGSLRPEDVFAMVPEEFQTWWRGFGLHSQGSALERTEILVDASLRQVRLQFGAKHKSVSLIKRNKSLVESRVV